MANKYALDPNALTDPPVYLNLRDCVDLFSYDSAPESFESVHLTNYQALACKLEDTYAANKSMNEAQVELTNSLRKRLKKIRKAIKKEGLL